MGFLLGGAPSAPAPVALPPAANPVTLADKTVMQAGANQKAAAAAAAIANGMNPTNAGAPATASAKLLGPT